MTPLVLFIFGACIGSFLDVVARRYDPDRFIFSQKVIGGRSVCESCGRTLRSLELIPLLSFAIQRGRCSKCFTRLSFEYPIVEALSGLIFVFVPQEIHTFLPFAPSSLHLALTSLWVLALLLLLLLSLIDMRLRIIPDEITILLAVIGVFAALLVAPYFGETSGSFLGSSAMILGIRGNIILNRAAGIGFGAFLFGALVLGTRGRGMGMGDFKLAAAFGILFGWPDVIAIAVLAFVIGALVGLGMILAGHGGMKSLLPFGPFLALGAVLIFFVGAPIAAFYFGLAGFSL